MHGSDGRLSRRSRRRHVRRSVDSRHLASARHRLSAGRRGLSLPPDAEVGLVLTGRDVAAGAPLLLQLGRLRGSHDLPLEPGRTFVEDGEELFGELVQEGLVGLAVDVVEPLFAFAAGGDLVAAPFAGQVDAHASHDGGRVAQAHGR